ncbi:hypothetical protein B0H14DRAFT_3427903 [Mycena olivaceomarginata]|nr:hypothetical protein B0H14DRAFT_3427903 [Mycena olivaceomarginata]
MAPGPDAKLRSPADQEYLDSLSGRQLMVFRNYLFSPTYIKDNAGQFLDHDWVNVQRTGQNPVPDLSSTPSSSSIHIKVEVQAPSVPDVIKAEPELVSVPPAAGPGNVKMRTLNEGGREVLELLSESEPENNHEDSDLECSPSSSLWYEALYYFLPTADFTDPAFDSTFDFMSDFEFNTILSDVEHLNTVFVTDNILPTFAPGFLGCGGSASFGTSVPDSGSRFDNPADDFMDLYGLPTFFSDPIGTSDFSPRRIHLRALPPRQKNQPRHHDFNALAGSQYT